VTVWTGAPSIQVNRAKRVSGATATTCGVRPMPERSKKRIAATSAPSRSRLSVAGDFFRAKQACRVSTRQMRVLLPLRSSATRSTGSGLSRRATAWISSGNVEDGIADFVPGYVVLECVVGVAPEQDLAAGPRHLRMPEDLGEIVDEHIAAQRRDATYLLLARAFEED